MSQEEESSDPGALALYGESCKYVLGSRLPLLYARLQAGIVTVVRDYLCGTVSLTAFRARPAILPTPLDRRRLEELLHGVRSGETTVEQALGRLSHFTLHDLGHTRIDTQREARCGSPEVVFGESKEPGSWSRSRARSWRATSGCW